MIKVKHISLNGQWLFMPDAEAVSMHFELPEKEAVSTNIECLIDTIICWAPDNPQRYKLVI